MEPRRLEQHEGADDIGLDERLGAVDRAVDMALGGEVHHDVGAVSRERRPHGAGIADVDLREGIARIVGDGCEVVEVAGVGELVEAEHLMRRIRDQMAHDRRSDEAGAAGDQETHR